VLLAIPAFAAFVVWFMGGPLPQCIGGVGPSQDAARAECARRWVEALPPFERFNVENPWAMPLLVFVALLVVLLIADAVLRRRRGRSG
jgi:hypothetical protein